jgi:hypothetical protein
MRTDGQTDIMTKLIVAFRSFAKAPEKNTIYTIHRKTHAVDCHERNLFPLLSTVPSHVSAALSKGDGDHLCLPFILLLDLYTLKCVYCNEIASNSLKPWNFLVLLRCWK